MKLPNAERAVISEEKLRDYLLSESHPVGRFKAAYFRELGYHQHEWTRLAADLRTQHLILDAEEAMPSSYGRKFVIRGLLAGPAASDVVLSVWVIRSGEDVPRLVTAYPGGVS